MKDYNLKYRNIENWDDSMNYLRKIYVNLIGKHWICNLIYKFGN